MFCRRYAVLLAAVIVFAAGTTGCLREYDFTPHEYELGTLGQELHQIWIKDAARAAERAEQKARLLQERELEFVRAVDTIAPESELPAIDAFLQQTLSLIDDDTLPSLTRKTATALEDASNDEALMAALGDASSPQPADFVSPVAAPDLIGYVTTYPELRQLGLKGARIVLDNDGFTDAGVPDYDEPNGVSELTTTLSVVLEDVDAQVLDDSLSIIVRDMLLREDERFAVADATRPLFVAIYDSRGFPLPNSDVFNDLFQDNDADGLPDINDAGEFVLRSGETLPPSAFDRAMGPLQRDAFGRAQTEDDTFAFDYVDLNKTGLAFLIREYADLAERGVVTDLLATFRAIMGGTVIHEDSRGPYRGFNPDNPLMDLSWGAVHALGYEQLPELLDDSAEFFDRASPDFAGVVVALEESVEIAEKYPDAELSQTQTILFDMIPTLHEIAKDPELWSAFMAALGDPVTPKVGDAMVTLISYKNTKARPVMGGPYDACFMECKADHQIGTVERFDCIRACPNDEIFQQPMDFSAPESPENRSQLQATWHLMWGLAGVPYAMSMDRILVAGREQPQLPPLIRLDGGAEAFLAAVAGNLDIAEAVPPEIFTGSELGPLLAVFGINNEDIAGMVEFLSELFGVRLSRYPTHDELTRMFTQDDIIFVTEDNQTILDVAEPVDAEGYRLPDGLADGLYEVEASGLVDAVYPTVKAFSDRGKEHLLLDLFSVLHKHYPGDPNLYKMADGRVSPSQAANLRSFEPIIKEVLESGRMLQALFKLSQRLEQLERDRGVDLDEQLRLLVLHATKPSSLTTRDGQDFLPLPDGRTARDLAPLHILVDALDRIVDSVADDPEASERFTRAVSALLDLAIGAEWPAGEDPRFIKQGSVALTVSAMEFLADRARVKRDAGELESWLKQDFYGTLDELWTSRLLAGMVLIAEQLLEDEENRAVLDEFIGYLVGTPRGREHTSLIAYQLVVRSVNTSTWVPIARSLARILDPGRDWQTGDSLSQLPMISHGALALEKIMLEDEQEVGIALINRGLHRVGEQKAPIFVIGDILKHYFRLDPESDARLTAQDYRHFFAQVVAWIRDEAKGLEQLYDLVELRVKE